LAPPVPEVIGIDHIYITVTDLKRSEQFYDIVMLCLGFRKSIFQLDGETHIHYYNRHFSYVLRPARDSAPYDAYTPGIHHLCLRVHGEQDVNETVELLEKSSIAVSEPRLYPQYAPDYYAVYFRDPDGMHLEVTNYRLERRQRHDDWENTGR